MNRLTSYIVNSDNEKILNLQCRHSCRYRADCENGSMGDCITRKVYRKLAVYENGEEALLG